MLDLPLLLNVWSIFTHLDFLQCNYLISLGLLTYLNNKYIAYISKTQTLIYLDEARHNCANIEFGMLIFYISFLIITVEVAYLPFAFSSSQDSLKLFLLRFKFLNTYLFLTNTLHLLHWMWMMSLSLLMI